MCQVPRSISFLVVFALALPGCSTRAQPPAAAAQANPADGAPQSVAHHDAQPDRPVELEPVPLDCAAREGALCLPTASFVQRLCASPRPEVALAMFGKGTPWTRGYLRRSTEAWDALRGGRDAAAMKLGEEVLVLTHRGASGDMQVSNSGSYDVLRWDGVCVSLMQDEVSLKRPPQASHARIPWKRLDDAVRMALSSDEAVQRSSEEFRKECKGSGWGEPTKGCAKADDRLSLMVVEYVRRGGAVPPPGPLPP
jgi:hypothetical protein